MNGVAFCAHVSPTALGHADIQMTANIYGHLDTSRKRELTENIAGSIFAAC